MDYQLHRTSAQPTEKTRQQMNDTPVNDTPILRMENIHKSFGKLEVLHGISLEARSGDVISLIGSSGSGKSTFLRCINLLEMPEQGEIFLEGRKEKSIFPARISLRI